MRNLQNRIRSKTHKAPDYHPQRAELDKGRVWGGRGGEEVGLGHEKVLPPPSCPHQTVPTAFTSASLEKETGKGI